MIEAVDIRARLADLPLLKGRTPQSDPEEEALAFATLATLNGRAGVFTGSFQGQSAWERHPAGDELVQVMAGQTSLTVLTGEGAHTLEMRTGMITVIPKGCWHRFEAADSVSLLTVTPQPTEHSAEEIPSAIAP